MADELPTPNRGWSVTDFRAAHRGGDEKIGRLQAVDRCRSTSLPRVVRAARSGGCGKNAAAGCWPAFETPRQGRILLTAGISRRFWSAPRPVNIFPDYALFPHLTCQGEQSRSRMKSRRNARSEFEKAVAGWSRCSSSMVWKKPGGPTTSPAGPKSGGALALALGCAAAGAAARRAAAALRQESCAIAPSLNFGVAAAPPQTFNPCHPLSGRSDDGVRTVSA